MEQRFLTLQQIGGNPQNVNGRNLAGEKVQDTEYEIYNHYFIEE